MVSGYLNHRLDTRIGPPMPSRDQRTNLVFNLLLGGPLGFLFPLSTPFVYKNNRREARMLNGPFSSDSLQSCLRLKADIQADLATTERQMARKQALIGGVKALLEADFSQEVAERAGINPVSGQMPNQAGLRQAWQDWTSLNERRKGQRDSGRDTQVRPVPAADRPTAVG